MKHSRIYALLPLLLLLLFLMPASGIYAQQRRVSPVNNASTATQAINENKLPADSIDRSKLVQFRDNNGNIVLVDTVTGMEIADTMAVAKIPPMIYPLVYEASVAVNLWDPLMKAFGQSYGLVGFSAHFNMHNRYIAAFEFGLGKAQNTPADNNYTYHSPMAPYFKIGLDYNFLYNSNPDYQAYAGIRYGFTPFKWTLHDVTIDGSYWGDPSTMQFPDINATAGYVEFLFGIKVRLFSHVSMGWSLRYHRIIHCSPKTYGRPWYVPGYGSYGSALGASLSVYYDLPLSGRKQPQPIDLGPVSRPDDDDDTVHPNPDDSSSSNTTVTDIERVSSSISE
ncbi:MAG: DUF6048 family protein [Clostridiales bacterium]|nr:DUF6048 family protein [Clostridiales bacterium]